jgi:hypothetical protein
MPQSRGIVLLVIGAGCLALAPSRSAIAQLGDRSNGAALFSPVDASALGVERLSSVGLSLTDAEFVAGGGLRMRGGALRGYAGGGAFAWSTGLGYSTTFVRRSLASGLLHGTVGGQVTGGYRHRSYAMDAGGLNMTIPVGVTVGNPDRRSLALYAAPYTELGVEHFRIRSCPVNGACGATTGKVESVYAAGMGMGMRASLGRFAVGIFAQDFGGRRRWIQSTSIMTIGFSMQLGQTPDE